MGRSRAGGWVWRRSGALRARKAARQRFRSAPSEARAEQLRPALPQELGGSRSPLLPPDPSLGKRAAAAAPPPRRAAGRVPPRPHGLRRATDREFLRSIPAAPHLRPAVLRLLPQAPGLRSAVGLIRAAPSPRPQAGSGRVFVKDPVQALLPGRAAEARPGDLLLLPVGTGARGAASRAVPRRRSRVAPAGARASCKERDSVQPPLRPRRARGTRGAENCAPHGAPRPPPARATHARLLPSAPLRAVAAPSGSYSTQLSSRV